MTPQQSLALVRIEMKLDMLLAAVAALEPNLATLLRAGELNFEGYDGDICPVCLDSIHVTIDIANESYNRTCGCKPRTALVPGISALTKPRENTPSEKVAHLREEEDLTAHLPEEPSRAETSSRSDPEA